MSERCSEIVYRTPVDRQGVAREEHTYAQRCRLPAVQDGLCVVHVRKRDAEPDRRLAARLRRMLGR